MRINDIVGKRFGSYVVLGRDESYISNKHSKWICRCDCGAVRSVFKTSLLQGHSKSCGCKRYDNRKGQNATHGMSKTRLYQEWLSMKRRCRKESKDAHIYFMRGIAVSEEWQNDFLPFYYWAMENGYSDELSLDRIDNNKGYSPDNCRWITIEEQQSNKGNTVYILYDGKQYCLRALCRELGFPYKTAHRRLQRMKARGASIDTNKLFEPIHKEKIAVRYRNAE